MRHLLSALLLTLLLSGCQAGRTTAPDQWSIDRANCKQLRQQCDNGSYRQWQDEWDRTQCLCQRGSEVHGSISRGR
ncbi:lipoprotein [Ferrimonas marina]|uniref:Lipoprotein n=1 Tax=Ferrimonas marina TaxID=299255 RepID=A0A1M5ZB37_9GAMM|nr:lipoprotein [Ferrimonas marina]SHI21461.1 hypothetical protein SAMN02745129_0139 [Ferrimonas marina]